MQIFRRLDHVLLSIWYFTFIFIYFLFTFCYIFYFLFHSQAVKPAIFQSVNHAKHTHTYTRSHSGGSELLLHSVLSVRMCVLLFFQIFII